MKFVALVVAVTSLGLGCVFLFLGLVNVIFYLLNTETGNVLFLRDSLFGAALVCIGCFALLFSQGEKKFWIVLKILEGQALTDEEITILQKKD